MGDIEQERTRAQTALRVAESLLEQGLWDDAANRLYYSAFHAARAMLWRQNPRLAPKSHRGVMTLFARELVLPGRVPPEYSTTLSRLNRQREQADYGGGGASPKILQEELPRVKKMVEMAR